MPLWSGNLTFGLVSFGVRMVSATSSHRIDFRQVHRTDMGRVRNQKTCSLDGRVLAAEDIGRAYETPGGDLVELSDTELALMPLPTLRTIEISGFLPLASVRPEQLDTPRFLAPAAPAANKPYVLMREALARSGKAGVGKVAIRNSEHLVLVYPHGLALAVHRLHWPDEMVPAAGAAPRRQVELTDDELAGAAALIEAMGDVDLAAYRDGYAHALTEVLAAKTAHQPPPVPPVRADKAGPVDLMT